MTFCPLRILLVSAAHLPLVLSACTYSPHAPGPSARRVEEVARFEQDQCTGVAVSRTGRLFVSFPFWHDGHRIHVAEVNVADGTYRPYPDEAWNAWHGDGPIVLGTAPDHWVCVQAVHVDDRDRLWVLDPASPRMAGIAENARPKLVRFDLSTNEPTRMYFFDADAAPPGSYLNDVRIDSAGSRAFITDSKMGGLVVVDLDSGVARRVLDGHPSAAADPDVVLHCEGRPLVWASGPNAGKPPMVHTNGLALDPSGGWVYWQPMTGRTLYRAPIRVLGDLDASDEEIASSVQRVGSTVATDAMEFDARGNLYFTDFENNAVVVRTRAGEMRTLIAGPLLSWPASLALGADGWLYVTTAQAHRTRWFTADGSMPATPYRVFRTRQYVGD